MDTFTRLVCETFGVGPRLSIHGRSRRTVPSFEHKDAVLDGPPWLIDDKRSAQQGVHNPIVAAPAVRSSRPVQIGARRTGHKAHVFGSPRRNGDDVVIVPRPLMQSVYCGWNSQLTVQG